MRFISTTSVVLSALLFTASARPQNFVPSTNATSFSIDQQVLEAVSLGQLVPANAPWDLARFAQKDKLQPGAAGMGTSETSRDWKFPICDLTPKQDVLIYVLDLGVRASHKEFGGRVLPGKDYEGGSDTSDSDGHGTAAAGCAAGATVGVSRWAKIVPIKVAPQRQLITPADVAEGLNNVLDHFVPLMSKVAGGIISISITTFRNVEIQGLFKQAMDKYGMHIVTAAGNQDKDQCAEWAENVGQINVGATDIQDHRAKFPTGGEPGSNFGPCVDIYAPGRSIQTASYTSDTAIELQHGTSFAAPQVAGIIANKIIKSGNKSPATMKAEILGEAVETLDLGAGAEIVMAKWRCEGQVELYTPKTNQPLPQHSLLGYSQYPSAQVRGFQPSIGCGNLN